MRIGSLFSGYGGLDRACEEVFGADTAWVSDIDPGACKILAHRYPDIPNIGDITAVDWAQIAPVDVLTGGFPCQDLSHAGKRAGMHGGTRSGLWSYMAEAIATIRPRYVVAENVRGLLSATATSDVEPCPWCLGDTWDREHALRALGCVLGDLADIGGYDVRWCGLRAADVGAPHGRFRVFVVATDTERGGRDGRSGASGSGRRLQPADRSHAAADPIGSGRERARTEPGDRGAAADIPSGDGRAPERMMGYLAHGIPTEGRSGQVLRDLRSADVPQEVREEARGSRCVPEAAALRTELRQQQDGSNEGRAALACEEAQAAGVQRVPGDNRSARSPQGPQPSEQRPSELADPLLLVPSQVALAGGPGEAHGRCGEGRGYGCSAWGQYSPAIHRWEIQLGRLAPSPTEVGPKGSHRLSPPAVEFMMGLPEGHVCDVPDLTRSEQLKALGNGVVPQQALAALQLMLTPNGSCLTPPG
jgi:DNA (cytosine-5)-methyltransferase 1